MSCTHRHRGRNHNPGDTPTECSTNCRGRVTYCGPEIDDPFRDDHFCEHEDTPSAAGQALNIPADSVTRRVGNPGPWSRPRRIPGNPPGSYRLRKISRNYFDLSPFHSQNIPCNPDQPGSVTVSETVTRTVKLSVSVTGKIKDIVSATATFDISQTRTLTANVVLHGEKCRSVEYRFFVRYELWELDYFPPDTTSVPRTLLRFFIPVGWYADKSYVQPTCCTQTSSLLHKALDERIGEADYTVEPAAYAASDALLTLRGMIVDPRDHYSLVPIFGEALTALGSLKRSEAVDFTDIAERTRALMDDFVAGAVASAADICAIADDVTVLPETFHAASASLAATLAKARATPDDAAAADLYHAAYHDTQALEKLAAGARQGLNIEHLPGLDIAPDP